MWKSFNGVLRGKNGWMGDDGGNGNRIEKGPNPAFPAPSLHHHQFNSITHIFFLFHFSFVTSGRLVSLSFFLLFFLSSAARRERGKEKRRGEKGEKIYIKIYGWFLNFTVLFLDVLLRGEGKKYLLQILFSFFFFWVYIYCYKRSYLWVYVIRIFFLRK